MHRRRIAVSQRQFQSCSGKRPYMIEFSSVGTRSDTGAEAEYLDMLSAHSAQVTRCVFQPRHAACPGHTFVADRWLANWVLESGGGFDRIADDVCWVPCMVIGRQGAPAHGHDLHIARAPGPNEPRHSPGYRNTLPRYHTQARTACTIASVTGCSHSPQPVRRPTSSRPAGPGVPRLAPTTQLLLAQLPPHHASSQAPPPTTTTHSSPPADRLAPHPGSHAPLCVLSTTSSAGGIPPSSRPSTCFTCFMLSVVSTG